MNALLDRFECVRLVRMNGLDLQTFQFDYDQTWAVLFFRHDGTLLARYGTRADKDGMKHNSPEGFTSAMRSVLAVDESWQAQLLPFYDAKRGPKVQHKTADDIPSETITRIKEREKSGKQGCIHCHNVYDAQRDVAIQLGEYEPSKRFKYPMPENIGLEIDEQLRISKVTPESPAEKAGLKARHRIQRVDGQNMHTLADVQFALHHIDDPGRVMIVTASPDISSAKLTESVVELPEGWRQSDIGWRASMYGMPPKPGLWVQALDEEKKSQRGIANEDLALLVRGVFGNDVRKHGVKKGDVIVQFGDETNHHAEGEFHAKLRLNYYEPNSKLVLKVLRDGKPKDLTVVFKNK